MAGSHVKHNVEICLLLPELAIILRYFHTPQKAIILHSNAMCTSENFTLVSIFSLYSLNTYP